MEPLLFILLLLSIPLSSSAQLQVGFYRSSCPKAESIVHSVVRRHFASDPSITAALLRLHFHDCFVRGCDASLLIDSTNKSPSEKDAVPNLTVRGYHIIADAKSELETHCPSTVSCADVEAIATRDAVALAGGRRYSIPTGRRDGPVSTPQDVLLPGPNTPVRQVSRLFASKGLSTEEMVVLLGAHTVGVAHCGFFRDRLFDFRGTGEPDPSMDKKLRRKLARVCGRTVTPGKDDKKSFLDQETGFLVDNGFYGEIVKGRGVLQIDQELAVDNSTARLVAGFARDGGLFRRKLAEAMVKMGKVEVLVGSDGEIRRNCSVHNKPFREE